MSGLGSILESLPLRCCDLLMTVETENHELYGAEFEYAYAELGTVIVNFYDGLVKFNWIDGPLAGESGSDFPYRVKQLSDDQFLANWHEPKARGFVTLFIDLAERRVYSSVLASYATPEEQVWLHEATLKRSEGL